MGDGIEITSLCGNCPVQAEGTFDGVPFYFRARGTSVTCDVGPEEGPTWEWRGPEYEWPDAGWITEEVARAFIGTAYMEWRSPQRAERDAQRAAYRKRNDQRLTAIRQALAQPIPEEPPHA